MYMPTCTPLQRPQSQSIALNLALKSAFLCLSVSSECLGSQQTVLHQLCVTDQSASDDVELVSLLYWPLQQLHQYSRVLLKLAACFDVVRKELQLLLLLLSALEFFFSHTSRSLFILQFLFLEIDFTPMID